VGSYAPCGQDPQFRVGYTTGTHQLPARRRRDGRRRRSTGHRTGVRTGRESSWRTLWPSILCTSFTSEPEARSGVPKLVRMQARHADSSRSAVEGCAPKDRRARSAPWPWTPMKKHPTTQHRGVRATSCPRGDVPYPDVKCWSTHRQRRGSSWAAVSRCSSVRVTPTAGHRVSRLLDAAAANCTSPGPG
jgi:hypothetical protein